MDRLLALALSIYEDNIDPSHGQRKDLAMDPDLADQWTWLDPVRDHAAKAMAEAAETTKDDKHPESFRYVLGLREGWENVRAARQAGRAAEPSD